MRKLISLIIIALLLIVNFNLIQSIFSSSEKLSEVNKIEDRVKDLEDENKKLKATLEERDSNFYIEKEARNKLGFGKEGETTIVVSQNLLEQEKVSKNLTGKSNFEKWLELITN
jgi:cell division protein FtsB